MEMHIKLSLGVIRWGEGGTTWFCPVVDWVPVKKGKILGNKLE